MEMLLTGHGVGHIGCLAREIEVPPYRALPCPNSTVTKRVRVKYIIRFVKLAAKAIVGLLKIESASISIS